MMAIPPPHHLRTFGVSNYIKKKKLFVACTGTLILVNVSFVVLA